jgi:hypothetical protein
MVTKFTTLNPGSGGSVMDETGIVYSSPGEPTDRRRARVVVAGEGSDELASCKNTQNTGTEYGLTTRPIPVWFDDLTFQYGSANLTGTDPETSLVEYTIPTGFTFFMTGLNCTSLGINGAYRVYLNTGATDQQVLQFITTASGGYNVVYNSSVPMVRGVATNIIKIKATNLITSSAVSTPFEATLLGFLVPTA